MYHFTVFVIREANIIIVLYKTWVALCKLSILSITTKNFNMIPASNGQVAITTGFLYGYI